MKSIKNIVLLFFLFCLFKINDAQIINKIAGLTLIGGFSGDGGQATAAEISTNRPSVLCFDHAGNYYISDYQNHRVRKVNKFGIISTYAGDSAAGYNGDGGPATAAELNHPASVAWDKFGNLYIADEGSFVVRKVNSSGIITTFAGNGNYGYTGDGGPATAAEFHDTYGVATDDSGNVYIADMRNQVIRKVNTSGIISTFAGNGYLHLGFGGYSGDGGPANAAELNMPYGVAVDDSNNVFIADQYNCFIRKVNTSGIINSIAGNGVRGFSGDGGQATSAELWYPTGVTIDKGGNMYIADNGTRVRKVNTSGIISNIAGIGLNAYSGDGGPATVAEINIESGLIADSLGNVLFADGGTVREIFMNLVVSANGVANISCNGGNNGTASIMPSEGLMPYTYTWSNGATSSSLTDLSAGTYTVNVVDSENVKGSIIVTITQPSALSIIGDSINATGNNCNGSAWVAVTGGTSAYNYLWTGSLTTDTIQNQCAGTYCCMITDANGCKDSTCVTINMTTDVQSIVSEPPINVYPNPSNGNFTLGVSNVTEKCNVEIYNVVGEKIYQSKVNSNSTGISLCRQPQGMYFYRILKETGGLVGSGKVIIEK